LRAIATLNRTSGVRRKATGLIDLRDSSTILLYHWQEAYNIVTFDEASGGLPARYQNPKAFACRRYV
jgi:hypothetical protein